jgi:hypothetical protein
MNKQQEALLLTEAVGVLTGLGKLNPNSDLITNLNIMIDERKPCICEDKLSSGEVHSKKHPCSYCGYFGDNPKCCYKQYKRALVI